MKKLLLILLLSLPFTVWALSPVFLDQVSSSSVGCGGTQTFVGNPGDTETFEYQEGDFCCTEFVEEDNDGIISTYDNTQVKNGSYATSFAYTGSGAQGDCNIKVDLGSLDGDFTFDFWFWPHDYNDYNEYYFLLAAELDNKATSYWGFRLKHKHESTGSWKLEIYGTGSPDDTSSAYSSEAWYRLEVDFNQNGASTVKIYNASDVLQETCNFTAKDYAIRYIFWGCTYDSVHARATNYLDDVRYKSSGGGF